MSRLFIRRKTGYMSPYPLSMFYGAWRAGIYFGNNPRANPYVRLGKRYRRVPDWLMWVFRQFNRYTETQKGERFV